MATPSGDGITFSFGENWQDFLETVTEEELALAEADILEHIPRERIEGARVLDIGCGSGIHSLCFQRLGATDLHSFDYDPNSVAATTATRAKFGSTAGWTVEHGSVLDPAYLEALGDFDIVYSWGVLHHTGSMWEAIGNAMGKVRPGGMFWITLYVKGPNYERDLALKQRYNEADERGKRKMVRRHILREMYIRLQRGKNPLAWNETKARGMNVYNDIVDWLGGLPYEVASEQETVAFARERGFEPLFVDPRSERTCALYVFERKA